MKKHITILPVATLFLAVIVSLLLVKNQAGYSTFIIADLSLKSEETDEGTVLISETDIPVTLRIDRSDIKEYDSTVWLERSSSDDGYLYYHKIINPGDRTLPLPEGADYYETKAAVNQENIWKIWD